MEPEPLRHCRITRVRMKAGGADVRIVRRPEIDILQDQLLRFARQQAIESAPLAGFMLLSWDERGCYQISCKTVGDENPIPLALLPSWAEEIIRRELVTTKQIHEVIERDYDVHPPRRPQA